MSNAIIILDNSFRTWTQLCLTCLRYFPVNKTFGLGYEHCTCSWLIVLEYAFACTLQYLVEFIYSFDVGDNSKLSPLLVEAVALLDFGSVLPPPDDFLALVEKSLFLDFPKANHPFHTLRTSSERTQNSKKRKNPWSELKRQKRTWNVKLDCRLSIIVRKPKIHVRPSRREIAIAFTARVMACLPASLSLMVCPTFLRPHVSL